jgi:hypothetical protein
MALVVNGGTTMAAAITVSGSDPPSPLQHPLVADPAGKLSLVLLFPRLYRPKGDTYFMHTSADFFTVHPPSTSNDFPGAWVRSHDPVCSQQGGQAFDAPARWKTQSVQLCTPNSSCCIIHLISFRRFPSNFAIVFNYQSSIATDGRIAGAA